MNQKQRYDSLKKKLRNGGLIFPEFQELCALSRLEDKDKRYELLEEKLIKGGGLFLDEYLELCELGDLLYDVNNHDSRKF